MKTVRYYIGTDYDKDNNTIKDIEKLKSEAKRKIGLIYGGSTMYNGLGSWFDGQKLVNENSITIEILTKKPEHQLKETAEQLKKLFNQSSILLTVQEVASEFV